MCPRVPVVVSGDRDPGMGERWRQPAVWGGTSISPVRGLEELTLNVSSNSEDLKTGLL